MAYIPPTHIPAGWRVLGSGDFQQKEDKFWTLDHWAYCSRFGEEVGEILICIRKIDSDFQSGNDYALPRIIEQQPSAKERVKTYLGKSVNK